MVTAYNLLDCPGTDDALNIPSDLLADLHDPRLIITDAYIGPDPRTLSRRERRSRRQGGGGRIPTRRW